MTGKDVGHAGTYKLWGQEQMHGAIDAVLNEGMSIHRAAKQYGVCKSSLGDCLSGRVLEGASCGPAPYLSVVEELVVFLTRCATIGLTSG